MLSCFLGSQIVRTYRKKAIQQRRSVEWLIIALLIALGVKERLAKAFWVAFVPFAIVVVIRAEFFPFLFLPVFFIKMVLPTWLDIGQNLRLSQFGVLL